MFLPYCTYYYYCFFFTLTIIVQALVEKTNLNPAEVGDIVVGTVLAPGSLRATECRMASFYAGFPRMILCLVLFVGFFFSLSVSVFLMQISTLLAAETVPIRTVNRQCSSGLQAVADVAAAIKAGFYDIGNKKCSFFFFNDPQLHDCCLIFVC